MDRNSWPTVRLLAVRLFPQNLSSSYLIQRDCKPRRYSYNKGLRKGGLLFFSSRAYALVSRGFAARVL